MLVVVAAILTVMLRFSPLVPVAGSADCRHLPAPPGLDATANDNRARAGTEQHGVLTVRLVAQSVAWRPDGPAGCALSVHAFAEEGKQPQIPGPLIRVRSGAEVRVSVRNALAVPLWVCGLQDRSAGPPFDSTRLEPGATRDFSFTATMPGAWFYSAGQSSAAVPASNADGQLVGALVVDTLPAGATALRDDRVLVLTRWSPTGTLTASGYQLNAINGLSWPHTERLTYTQGDSVLWHVINPSNAVHEMHLHGFFFSVPARGLHTASTAPVPPNARRVMRVTSVMRPGECSLAWHRTRQPCAARYGRAGHGSRCATRDGRART
jgi:FtsP/CotA-like multicopper oxidase with cupredoxin domain